jgi:hypothetical protein
MRKAIEGGICKPLTRSEEKALVHALHQASSAGLVSHSSFDEVVRALTGHAIALPRLRAFDEFLQFTFTSCLRRLVLFGFGFAFPRLGFCHVATSR